MAFYGERFRREDEENIWEELKRTLMNPVSDEEMTLKQQQEQAKINAVLEKMFPTEVKQIKAQEPYLRYEDLLDDTSKNESRKINLTSPQNDIGSKIDIPEKLKEVQSIEEMKDAAEQIKTKADEVLTKDNLKKAAGVGLQAASVIPQTRNAGIIAKGASALGKKIVPKVGRKLAQEISEGVVNGAASGALEGLGRGILTDENPLKTTLQDTIIGTTLGAAGGIVGGNIQKAVRGKKLRKTKPISEYSKSEIKDLRNDATNYYKDYIQGTTVKRADMDDISFGNVGIDEVKSRGMHNIKILPDLKKQIKTGVKKDSKYDYDREDISNFDIIENTLNDKKYEYQIAEDVAQKQNKFYNIKDITNQKQDSLSTGWNHHPGSKENPSNIIPPSQYKFNPTQQATQNKMSYKEWLEELKRKRKIHGW